MPDPISPKRPLGAAVRSRLESAAVDLAPDALLKPDVVHVAQGVLTVKNKELGELIQSKLAAASQLAAAHGPSATDTDVGVSVKVHF